MGHHIAVNAREEHLHIAPVDQRATLLTLVVIGVIGRELIGPGVGDLGGRHRAPLSIVLRQRGVGLSIDQRSTTILLTREVVSEGKDISRSILIHRNIRVGSHQDHTIGADTGEEESHRHGQVCQSVSICPLGVPEVPDKSGNHDDRDDPTAAHKWDPQQDAGGEEAHPEEVHRHGSSHRCIEGESHHKRQHEDVADQTTIVAETKGIDEEEVKVSRHLRHTRDDAEEDHCNKDKGQQRSYHSALPRRLFRPLEVVHQRHRRDRQQIEQMDSDTQSHEVRCNKEPAVLLDRIARLLPLQYEIKNERCEET